MLFSYRGLGSLFVFSYGIGVVGFDLRGCTVGVVATAVWYCLVGTRDHLDFVFDLCYTNTRFFMVLRYSTTRIF